MKYILIIISALIIIFYLISSSKIRDGYSYVATNSYIFRICKFNLKTKKILIIITACRSETYNEDCYFAIDGKKVIELDIFEDQNGLFLKSSNTKIPIHVKLNRKIEMPYDQLCLLTIGHVVKDGPRLVEFKYTKQF